MQRAQSFANRESAIRRRKKKLKRVRDVRLAAPGTKDGVKNGPIGPIPHRIIPDRNHGKT